jgi:hypothetical protein
LACDVRVMTGMRKWGLRRFPTAGPVSGDKVVPWARAGGERHVGHVFGHSVACGKHLPQGSYCINGLHYKCKSAALGLNAPASYRRRARMLTYMLALVDAAVRIPLRASHPPRCARLRTRLHRLATAHHHSAYFGHVHAFIKFVKSSLQCGRGILGSTSDCLPAEVGGV